MIWELLCLVCRPSNPELAHEARLYRPDNYGSKGSQLVPILFQKFVVEKTHFVLMKPSIFSIAALHTEVIKLIRKLANY